MIKEFDGEYDYDDSDEEPEDKLDDRLDNVFELNYLVEENNLTDHKGSKYLCLSSPGLCNLIHINLSVIKTLAPVCLSQMNASYVWKPKTARYISVGKSTTYVLIVRTESAPVQ